MSDAALTTTKPLLVALAGNPNSGKTTLFNQLTGLRQKIANYPGVTVERKEGRSTRIPDREAAIIDLPGAYSLSAHSQDEQIAVEVITGAMPGMDAPDLVVAVVDATNLERNLYLVTQLLDCGRRMVVALNMIDEVRAQGKTIDHGLLSQRLGVPVVPIAARQGEGLDELARVIAQAALAPAPRSWVRFPDAMEKLLARFGEVLAETSGVTPPRAELIGLFCGEAGPGRLIERGLPDAAASIETLRAELSSVGIIWWSIEQETRYGALKVLVAKVERRPGYMGHSKSIALDRVLTHRVFGPVVFLAMMALMFEALFRLAEYPMSWIETGVAWLGDGAVMMLPAGLLRDLIVEGVIAGVGSVVVFLPQILILFFFIALFEDVGYMARAAFMMDRLMKGVGLHGKSFIPLLSSFACAIPGIMAARTIENRQDRLATIMIAPLMSCSARLPVYTVLIGAFIPALPVFSWGMSGYRLALSWQSLTLMGCYLLGVVTAMIVAFIFKKTLLRGKTPPLILELPPYRRPSLRNIARMLHERGMSFLRKAGTIILVCAVLLWALTTFPRDQAVIAQAQTSREALKAEVGASVYEQAEQGRASPDGTGAFAEDDPQLAAAVLRLKLVDRQEAAQLSERSALGRLGKLIEPALKPFGADWPVGVGLIASLAAREVFVSATAIVYQAGDSEEDLSDTLRRDPLTGEPRYELRTAVALLVFYVYALMCLATVAVVRRETNSWRWPLFMLGYTLILAYGGAVLTYQLWGIFL